MPELSITFVRRREKPMSVKKIKAVIEAPRRVDDSGDVAADGYVYKWNDRHLDES